MGREGGQRGFVAGVEGRENHITFCEGLGFTL